MTWAIAHRKDFDSANASDQFRQHPDAQMSHPVTLKDSDNPPPWWIYQVSRMLHCIFVC